MRIGVLSDTHGVLDDAVFTYFAECDEVWHAGDFGSIGVLETLQRFKPLRGVYGNIDGAELGLAVPKELLWDCDGVKVFMTHDPTAKKALLQYRPDLFICGHSHILRVMRDPALKLLHMNPGACGYHGFHTVRTVLRFTAESGKVSAVEAIELGPRSRPRP